MTTKEEFVNLIIKELFAYLNSENSLNFIKKGLDISSNPSIHNVDNAEELNRKE